MNRTFKRRAAGHALWPVALAVLGGSVGVGGGCAEAENAGDAGAADASVATDAATDTPVSTDGTSDAAVSTDAATDNAAAMRAKLYDPAVVQTIELDISADNLAKMKAALPERIYVPAVFRWAGIELGNVGVRYKGNSSSSPNATHKRSFLIKFGEFEKGQRLFGLRRLALDNGIQFGSLFSERLITDTLSSQGVLAPRSNYAQLRLNGKPWGVYVNVERIDESFMQHRFGSKAGHLYKVHLGGPGAALEVLGSADAYKGAFGAKSDAADKGHEPLLALCKLIAQTGDDGLEQTLAAHLDVDGFLRQMAVFALAGAFDQYTGWNPHNYYLHRDTKTGRWTYLAWDLDVGFADNAFGCVPVIDKWNASWPLPRVPRPLIERILGHPALLSRYRKHADTILEAHFKPAHLGKRLDALYALIEAPLKTDPFPHVRVTNPGDTGYPGIVASMKAFMTKRYDRGRAELDKPATAAPAPAAPCKPGGKQPAPGPHKEGAPTNLEVVSATAAGVKLKWQDNAKGEIAHVVQRCPGAGCTDFANAVGQQGSAVSTATDKNVKPGMTLRYRVYALFLAGGGPVGSSVSNVVSATVK